MVLHYFQACVNGLKMHALDSVALITLGASGYIFFEILLKKEIAQHLDKNYFVVNMMIRGRSFLLKVSTNAFGTSRALCPARARMIKRMN